MVAPAFLSGTTLKNPIRRIAVATQIYVNLPVKDLKRSIGFFQQP